ncbi:MAG TPA: hypothetical protein VGJ30_09040 [Candidatus Angelobacter sp.]
MSAMKNILCCLSLVAGLAGIGSAEQLKGILIDKACSSKAVTGGEAAAEKHDRDCAMAAACQRSGYGVYTSDGKWVAFDDAGNQKAIAALKASQKSDDLKVTVDGTVQGDSIKVASLKLQ